MLEVATCIPTVGEKHVRHITHTLHSHVSRSLVRTIPVLATAEYFYAPHKKEILYSAIASVSTLIFIPSTSLKTEAQATVVAPVVKTSSTIRTCLFAKSAG